MDASYKRLEVEDLSKIENPILLDVREAFELEISRLDGIVEIPMREIPSRFGELDKERPIVVVCRSGNRSAQVAMFLVSQGFADVYNLEGGMNAYARRVDTSKRAY